MCPPIYWSRLFPRPYVLDYLSYISLNIGIKSAP
jgi:hypothetical protein